MAPTEGREEFSTMGNEREDVLGGIVWIFSIFFQAHHTAWRCWFGTETGTEDYCSIVFGLAKERWVWIKEAEYYFD